MGGIPDYRSQPAELAKDLDHLRLLSIGFYVASGLSFVFGLLPTIHVAIGLSMVAGRDPFSMGSSSGVAPPPFFGWMFVIIGSVAIVMGLTLAALNFLAARRLAARKSRVFCLVVGAVNCLNVPLGTLLGVFTIMVLSRLSVRALFDEPP